jgi:hypothetical protein
MINGAGAMPTRLPIDVRGQPSAQFGIPVEVNSKSVGMLVRRSVSPKNSEENREAGRS